MVEAITGQSIRSELAAKLPDEGCWKEHRTFSKSDIPPILYGEEKGHGSLEKWAEYRARKLDDNYCGLKKSDLGVEAKAEGNSVYIYQSTEQRIYHSVLNGEILDANCLRISEKQFYGEKPKYYEKYGEYHPGLVVKISGDYNPELGSYHNQPVVITEVIDSYHYEVKTESGEQLKIRDTDVKTWICSGTAGYSLSNQARINDLLQRFD